MTILHQFRRLRPRAASFLLTLCVALIASGCIVYEERIVFDAAGGGTLELTCGIDLSALSSLGLPEGPGSPNSMEPSMDEGDESEDTCGRSHWSQLPAGSVTVGDYTESANGVDGAAVRGIRVTAPFSSAPQLNELIALAQAASEGEDDASLGSALRLTVQGGVYTLSGHIFPLVPADADVDEIVVVLLASARRSLAVTLPGQVLAADADSRDGQTYTWRQEPTSRVARPVNVSWSPAGAPAASANSSAPTPAPQPTRAPVPTRTPAPTPTPRPTLTPELTRLTTATRVYGQGGDFTTNVGSKGGVNANSLEYPYAVATDRSGGLYVADPDRYRVLYYPAGSITATRVYGQPDLNTGSERSGTSVTADGPMYPFGLAVTAAGELYVSDAYNHRVLFYPAGQTSPTRVYGQQGSFITDAPNNGGVSANSLSAPEGLAVDASGGLYVADTDNARVLYFPVGATTATRVYGQQGSFSTNSPNRGGVSAQSLHSPTGLALDASGGLYVSDAGNARNLYYPAGQTTATRVYGQHGDFTTDETNKGSRNPTADTLALPRGLALDGAGGLYVADDDNERVLYFPAGSTTATRVYGQLGSFTSSESNVDGISATGLSDPMGVALDPAGNLYVADAYNSRVLVFPTS